MRRGFAVMLLISALGATASSAFGQYPYPYAPMPYGPMPMQYAPPMYGPQPMMMPQPYYPPPPMWQAPPPPQQRPNVYVYGPVTPIDASSNRSMAMMGTPVKSELTPVQATTPARSVADPSIRNVSNVLDTCGPMGCNEDDCGSCYPLGSDSPRRGHGHFIGDVGAYFLYPYMSSRVAYSRTIGAETGTTNFPRVVDFGPRASIGYLFHNTWGVRANYWYLRGSSNTSAANGDATTTLVTPGAPPFAILSPSASMQQGIGIDVFEMRQRLEIHVADVEILKECQVFDTTVLCSFGARYARIIQSYEATRDNAGGVNGANIVTEDREDLETSSRFNGWGPTVSLESVHRLGKSNLAVYGNIRGSLLFGVERFVQDYSAQRSAVVGGVANLTSAANEGYATDTRTVSIGELEFGLQYGCHLGCRCYVFGRAGVVYQRWWDVGNPNSASGDLTLLGGTARVGITY